MSRFSNPSKLEGQPVLKNSIVAGALLACAFATAGCGGSDKLSKGALAKKADAVCAKYNPKVKALGKPDLSSADASEKYFSKLSTISKDLRSDLGDLKPADSVKSEWNGLLDTVDNAQENVDQFAKAAKDQDSAAAKKLAPELQKSSQAISQGFDDFGAGKCGSQSS